MNFKKSIIISVLIVVLFSSVAFTRSHEEATHSADGIKGVNVLIDDFDEGFGITKQQLQADIEFRLGQNGIKVFSSEERVQRPGQPCLCLEINILKVNEIGFVANIHLELKEEVLLLRDLSKKEMATTWDIGGLAIMPPNKISSIRDYAKEYVDIFCTYYLALKTE